MHNSKRVLFALVVLLLAVAAHGWADQPQRVSGATALKAVVSKVDPEYPSVARQLKIEGEAQLEVLVDEAGSVEKVDVVSGNPVLTKAAADAVKKWRFSPFAVDGKATKAIAPVTVTFRR